MEYVYAALLLHKLGQDVNDANLTKVVSATGVEVDEAKVKLLANVLKDVNIDEELENAVAVASSAPVASEGEAPKEEKKEEKEEASAAAEGLSSLFG
jgi:large subunit ribosomal protein L12|tara:strand:- start:138 stop:428 length:291 start_codon:yes stop_codon:yes gene_type:complete